MMKKYEAYKDSGVEWVGKVPSHWTIMPLKYMFNNLDYLREPIASESRSKNNPIYDYYGASGIIDKIDFYNVNDTVLLIGEDGANLLGRNLPLVYKASGKFWVNNHAHILKPKDSCDYNFCALVLESANYDNEITGSAQPKLSQEKLNPKKFPCPPLSEQQAIANFLDHKASTIDKSVATINAEIEDLKAYRQSIISEAVTKGLNPDAPMKDSGVEWIGEIPEGWNIVPLKHNLSLKGRIGWNGLKSEEFEESSYAYLVTGQDFNSEIVDWSKCYQISKERYDEDPFIQLENGDLLVTKDGTIGKVAKVNGLDKPACLNSGIFVVKQTKSAFIQDYLYWILTSNQLKEFVGFNNTGSTIQHLYQNVFENMPLSLPPLTEQQTIATYLDEKTSKIDKSIKGLEAQRDDLKTLKQSIISEAVTGKIDVRDWKPNKA